jgi:transposase
MRKVKEVLRLRFELRLGQRQIARSCGMGLGTVHEYLERAVAAGIGWPLPEGLGEEELEAKLFGNQPVQAGAVRQRPQPDWKAIHEQLQQHRHLTLQLVWEEYRHANPEGYRYSWFCERYQHWRRHLDVVLRQEHKAGEKMFVDWAGATIPVYDATTGQAWPASLFVSVLGASSYTYAEATRDQQLEAWIQAHIHALEFFGGVPILVVPDNTKTAVTRACRYDPDLNPTYQEFAVYYGMGVVPARPYKPLPAEHFDMSQWSRATVNIDYHIGFDGNFYMLNQPMMEKLLAMRLQGMVEALKAQEQDRSINELSFLERLALLVGDRPAWRTSIIGLRVAWTRRWCVLWQETRPGSATTKTFSCWVRPAWARASSHRPWHRKLVATATRLSICGLPPCFGSWP